MVLIQAELIASLQNDVRILLHLAGKIDRAQLDYTQLFVYLKACGREELGTMNLWAGVDAPTAA
jgi:hypothetical protein